MTTFEDIKRLIDSHDYYYEYSDDHSAWRKGRDEYSRIQRALNDAEGETGEQARAYWKAYCAKRSGK